MRTLAIMAFVALAACGADGDPFKPTGSFGVNIGSGGVSTGGSIGATNGKVSVGIGF